VLPAVLARLRRRHPDVELEYTVSNTAKVEEMLIENSIDVGFVGGTISDPVLSVEPFMQDEIVCFASRRHPLAGRRRISATDLSRETLVLREEGSATRRLFTGWLHSSGGRIERRIELGCPEAVKAVVAAGLGVGCLSRLGLRDELARKRLVILRTPERALWRPLSAVRHPRKIVSPALRAFFQLLPGGTLIQS
jgi:DNA-binding transcriptional LysR family regulator